MIIQKITDKTNLFKYKIPEIVKNLSMYLENGAYESDALGYFIKKKDFAFPDFIFQIFDYQCCNALNKKVYGFIKQCALPDIDVEGEQKKFKGTLVKINHERCEYKIFDIVNDEILTIYSSSERFKTSLENHLYFNIYCNTSQIIEYDYKKLWIKEKFILSEQMPKEWIFEKLRENQMNYFNHCNSMTLMSLSYECLKMNVDDIPELKKLVEGIKYIFDHNLPVLKVHGDCWFSNLLCKDHEIYLIDFEGCHLNFFLYDFFTFIYTEYQFFDNKIFLDAFFTGEYDPWLAKAFTCFKLKYESEWKLAYFKLFYCLYFLDQLIDRSQIQQNKSLKQFKQMINTKG